MAQALFPEERVPQEGVPEFYYTYIGQHPPALIEYVQGAPRLRMKLRREVTVPVRGWISVNMGIRVVIPPGMLGYITDPMDDNLLNLLIFPKIIDRAYNKDIRVWIGNVTDQNIVLH